MRIRLEMGDRKLDGVLPYEACDYVLIPGADCPVCSDFTALVDQDNNVVALVRGDVLETVRKKHPDWEVQAYQGPLRIRLPNPTRQYDTYEGYAECTRCRRRVGTLVVTVDTVFGLEEDDRVLNGPYKVY